MRIGCVTELKNNEYRVGMTPENAREYVAHGHQVIIEAGAGEGSGFRDESYLACGAELAPSAADVWARADMVIKIKEPQPEEIAMIREGQVLFTYLHLAADKRLTDALIASGVKGVAYETLTDPSGNLPLLRPMSEIAGRLSLVEGAKCLERPFGGKGVLLSGVPGTKKAKVVILGGGVVGANACKMAVGLSANVTVIDVNLQRLAMLDDQFGGRITTLYSTPSTIAKELSDADLVIGAVLIPGAAAPKLITREMICGMQPGSVIVDVAVDQGGCTEVTSPTTHMQPTYQVDGVILYCVANMPGAVANTSTVALTNATLAYGLAIADKGLEAAAKQNPGIANAVNLYGGKCTHQGVADAFGLECHDPLSLMR